MTIVVIGSVRFPPENLSAIKPHLEKLLKATRENDGCISYNAAFDPYDVGLVRIFELWPDMAALEAHFAAPHMSPWREVAGQLGASDREFTAWEGVNPQPI